jgi:hypothetical protein
MLVHIVGTKHSKAWQRYCRNARRKWRMQWQHGCIYSMANCVNYLGVCPGFNCVYYTTKQQQAKGIVYTW